MALNKQGKGIIYWHCSVAAFRVVPVSLGSIYCKIAGLLRYYRFGY